ncbi:MAG: STAS domain-containing protein [Gammaproteobacteria bacterium]|nr:STAS domain-containing protein [Gammaproteobacteria bacterium]MCW5584102.1 STAS domain-containing protein [Gammaproteobacteria bacterium]
MRKIADITGEGEKFFLTGDLNFSNVMSVYEKSIRQLNQSPQWIFDFSQLVSSDSSGLALIIEWVKLAKQQNKPIQLLHLSQAIMSIAKVASIDVMLEKDCLGH